VHLNTQMTADAFVYMVLFSLNSHLIWQTVHFIWLCCGIGWKHGIFCLLCVLFLIYQQHLDMVLHVIITLRKERYKSCHWGCTFSKGTLLYQRLDI